MKVLSLSRLTRKQKRRATSNLKAKLTLESTLSVEIIKIRKYINTKELWERVVKMHERTLEAKLRRGI